MLVVELRNQPGALAHVCETLAAEHINIDYAYCSAGGRNGKTVGIFKVSNTEKAMRVLGNGTSTARARRLEGRPSARPPGLSNPCATPPASGPRSSGFCLTDERRGLSIAHVRARPSATLRPYPADGLAICSEPPVGPTPAARDGAPAQGGMPRTDGGKSATGSG